MTLHTTPPGKNPATMIERFEDGRVLVVILNNTGTHYCILMQVYSPDLSECETKFSLKYPLAN